MCSLTESVCFYQLIKLLRLAYVRVGRSLYCALNRMNCVKKGSVSLVVPIAMALARVPMMAMKRSMRSSTDTPLLTPLPRGAAFEVSPCSLDPFIVNALSIQVSP